MNLIEISSCGHDLLRCRVVVEFLPASERRPDVLPDAPRVVQLVQLVAVSHDGDGRRVVVQQLPIWELGVEQIGEFSGPGAVFSSAARAWADERYHAGVLLDEIVLAADEDTFDIMSCAVEYRRARISPVSVEVSYEECGRLVVSHGGPTRELYREPNGMTDNVNSLTVRDASVPSERGDAVVRHWTIDPYQ